MEKLKFSFMKKLHIGLLPRILIAIALGILFGNFLPGELVRLFVIQRHLQRISEFFHTTDYCGTGYRSYRRHR